MFNDTSHVAGEVIRANHPRAKDCFFISIVPPALVVCMAVLSGIDPFIDNYFPAEAIIKLLIVLLFITCILQPLGILLGIFSLYAIRKQSSYCGRRYAIAGIIISSLITCLILLQLSYTIFFEGRE
jgi:hypothetical protein